MKNEGATAAQPPEPNTVAPAADRYTAFLSYSHSDDEVANWLHERIESYRVPKGVLSPRPNRRMGKIFRDRVDLATSHDLGSEIRAALDNSDALILLCSRRSASSPYVAEEIRRFKETGKGTRIIPVIVDGEPHAAGKPGRSAEDECFPRALLYQVGPDGALTDHPETNEPIAADIREDKDGRENGALKVIAGLLGAGLDDLIQRQKRAERARSFRANAIAAAMTILALGALGGGVFAWQQRNEADVQRAQAEKQTMQALLQLSNAFAIEADRIGERQQFGTATLMALHANPEHPGHTAALAQLRANGVNDRLRVTLTGQVGGISPSAFSPDGARIVATSNDSTARIWDAATGSTLLTLAGQEGTISLAAFSRDGSRVVTASGDIAQIWDAATARPLLTLSGHSSKITSAAFSPDGRSIITGSWDKTARIWDAETGEVRRIMSGRWGYITTVAYSHDGTRVITGSAGSLMGEFDTTFTGDTDTARVWDATTGKPLLTLAGHGLGVKSAAFSDDGLRIVTVSQWTTDIWDARTGEFLLEFGGPNSSFESAAFSKDGARILTTADDTSAKLWDAESGGLLLTLYSGENRVTSAAFSPDGARIVAASSDAKARVWDVGTGLIPLHALADTGKSGAFSPDGTQVVTSYRDNAARVWDAATGQAITTLLGHENYVLSAAFSHDGRRIVTGSSDGTARIWDAAGKPTLPPLRHTEPVRSAAFSPDGTYVVTASETTARVWDAATGELRLMLKHNSRVNSASFSPDMTRIVTSSQDGTAHIWNPKIGIAGIAGVSLKSFRHEGEVRFAAFSPDGARIVTASDDRTARVWDVNTGTLLVTLAEEYRGNVTSAAFSPDGALIVTSSWGDTPRLWDATTGEFLLSLAGQQESSDSAAFSPDGETIITSSGWDDQARIWNVPEILLAKSSSRQFEMACGTLWKANAPLAFTVADAQQYPILQGQPIDPRTGDFISPCKGVLPDEAFAKPAIAGPTTR